MSKYLYNFLPIYPDYDENIENILGSDFVEEGNPSQVINEPREERTKKFLANVLEN